MWEVYLCRTIFYLNDDFFKFGWRWLYERCTCTVQFFIWMMSSFYLDDEVVIWEKNSARFVSNCESFLLFLNGKCTCGRIDKQTKLLFCLCAQTHFCQWIFIFCWSGLGTGFISLLVLCSDKKIRTLWYVFCAYIGSKQITKNRTTYYIWHTVRNRRISSFWQYFTF